VIREYLFKRNVNIKHHFFCGVKYIEVWISLNIMNIYLNVQRVRFQDEYERISKWISKWIWWIEYPCWFLDKMSWLWIAWLFKWNSTRISTPIFNMRLDIRSLFWIFYLNSGGSEQYPLPFVDIQSGYPMLSILVWICFWVSDPFVFDILFELWIF